MTGEDRLLVAVARLPQLAPDIKNESQVRRRCHSVLSRRNPSAGTRLLDIAAAAALCVYLVTVLTETIRLARLL
jgi:hypothetical protein